MAVLRSTIFDTSRRAVKRSHTVECRPNCRCPQRSFSETKRFCYFIFFSDTAQKLFDLDNTRFTIFRTNFGGQVAAISSIFLGFIFRIVFLPYLQHARWNGVVPNILAFLFTASLK